MSDIDETVPPAASTATTREDSNGHSDRQLRQQQQQRPQQQQRHDHGLATSVCAGGVTFDDSDDTDATEAIVVDSATDRTPLLTRRVSYRGEDGICNDRGADRVVVDGQELLKITYKLHNKLRMLMH
ncbi:hypothetical protein QTP88_024431 [Uroleucon formosanum]